MAAGFFGARQRAGEADGTSGKKRRGRDRMAGSDHADPELQAKIVRMAREHWRAALRVPSSKKREKSKLWMLICCPAAGRWMWRLGKKLKQG